MRIARVIGKITLNKKLAEVQPGSYILVRTCNRGTLAGKNKGNPEELVAFDPHNCGEGDLIGLVEGAEATVPFKPLKVPYDAYNACLIDTVNFKPILKVD
jgi:ethanolamine utilization protein EutN